MDGDSRYTKKPINHILLIAILFQVIFFILIAILFSRLPSDELNGNEYSNKLSISIDNISEIFPNFPDDHIILLESELYDIVKENTSKPELSTEVPAKIREGTEHFQYFENQNLNYLSAIIDVPGLNQSYFFFHEYSDDKNNNYASPNDAYVFLCLDNKDLIIYPEFDCNSRYDSAIYNKTVLKYLPFHEFSLFSARVDSENDSRIIVYPTSSEATQSNSRTYIKQVKEFIQSLGISPDIFTYDYIASDNFTYEQDLD